MNMRIVEEGKKAFKQGIDLDLCPYEDGSTEYYEWEEGWIEASEEYEDD
jgi:ribosome modulation factor